MSDKEIRSIGKDYEAKYGFHDPEQYVFKAQKGLSKKVIEEISGMKSEPEWMRAFRLRALEAFEKKPLPAWADLSILSQIDFENIYYYLKPTEKQGKTWEEVPQEIKETFDKLGIPEAERKFLAGVSAQYECLSADTVVFANPKATPIKDLVPGDHVYSLNEETKELEKHPVKAVVYKGDRPVFEVKAGNRRIKCTANHPFYALAYEKAPGRKRGRFHAQWRYLSDLRVGDYIAVVTQMPDDGQPFTLPELSMTSEYIGRNQFGVFPVLTKKLFARQQKGLRLSSITTKAFMWFLGLYLGDGFLHRPGRDQQKSIVDLAIPKEDQATRSKLQQVSREAFGYELIFDQEPYRVRIHSKPITHLLAQLGFDHHAKTKRVPGWVYSLPRSQKLAFIAGYIDSDGYLRATPRHNDAVLTSVNLELLRDIQRLGITVGLHVSDVYPFRSKMEYKGQTTERIAYRLLIGGDLSGLTAESIKCARGVKPKHYAHRYASAHRSPLKTHIGRELGFARIQFIKPAGVEPVYDIEVEGPHNFVAEGIVVHNSEVVYHSIRQDLEKQGVLFFGMDEGLKRYPELVKKYFGTVIPLADNKFAALNSAVWSGGSFIYVPKGVKVAIPLQAYFRINAENMGQFERTLIIADEGSSVHYVEGCTAPVYASDSLHSAVVELIALPHSRIRYTTIQNWSKNVYNLVTKRAVAHENAIVEWLDGNLGCLTGDAQLFLNPDGPVAIKEVQPGQKVYAMDFNAFEPRGYRVTATRMTGIQKTYHLVTENHRQIKATDNHPFLVLIREPRSNVTRLEWKPLRTLGIGDLIGIARGVPDEGSPRQFNYTYPAVPRGRLKHLPVLPKETTEELMWFLGLYVGDGYVEKDKSGRSRRVFLAVPQKDRARTRLERAIQEIFHVAWKPKGLCVTINSAVLTDWILSIGFKGRAQEKRIPQWVYKLPLNQRLAFIEGYMDADGCIRKQKVKSGKEFGQIVFASCHRQLLEDLKLLAIHCGLNPLKISEYIKKRRLWKGRLKEYRAYYLALNIRDNLRAIREKAVPRAGIEFVRVRSIEPRGEEPVYDVEVEGAHNFIANGIVVHNSKLTMKYPGVYLIGPKARGEVVSVAFSGKGQHQDAGAKMVHIAPETSSTIVSKSISKDGGRTSYRGLVKVYPQAQHVKSSVRCDALLMDEISRSDTYPTMEIDAEEVQIGHEATVSKVGEEQLFYLMSRGLKEQEATTMIVNGFFEAFTKELPLEYAVELNRLIQLEMEGSVG